jgi:undecaprenyl-diphosphatase
VSTADAQQWLGWGLVALWLAVAVVTATRRGVTWRPQRRTLVATGLGAVLFAAYAGVVDAVADPGPLAAADGPIIRWIIDHRSGRLTPAMVEISNLGGTLGMAVLAAIGIAVLLWRRRYRDALVVLVAAVVAGVLVDGLKNFYARPRPPAATQLVPEQTFALPSGHALGSVVVVGVLAVVVIRTLRSTAHRILVLGAATAVVVAIGVSRLYLGVHWLTDVLAGWALGGAWLAVCTAVLLSGVTPGRWRPRAARRRAHRLLRDPERHQRLRSEDLEPVESRRPRRDGTRGVEVEERGGGDVVVAGQVAAVAAPAQRLDVRPDPGREVDGVGYVPAVHPEALLALVQPVGPDDLVQAEVGRAVGGVALPGDVEVPGAPEVVLGTGAADRGEVGVVVEVVLDLPLAPPAA